MTNLHFYLFMCCSAWVWSLPELPVRVFIRSLNNKNIKQRKKQRVKAWSLSSFGLVPLTDIRTGSASSVQLPTWAENQPSEFSRSVMSALELGRLLGQTAIRERRRTNPTAGNRTASGATNGVTPANRWDDCSCIPSSCLCFVTTWEPGHGLHLQSPEWKQHLWGVLPPIFTHFPLCLQTEVLWGNATVPPPCLTPPPSCEFDSKCRNRFSGAVLVLQDRRNRTLRRTEQQSQQDQNETSGVFLIYEDCSNDSSSSSSSTV